MSIIKGKYMAIGLSAESQSKLITYFKSKEFSDSRIETLLTSLSINMSEPLLRSKSTKQESNKKVIDHNSNDQSVKRSVTDRLDNVVSLCDKLIKELKFIESCDTHMQSRLSQLIGISLPHKQRLPSLEQLIPVRPTILVEVIKEEARGVSEDFKSAYTTKYSKIISDVLDYWYFDLDNGLDTATCYREGQFIEFLSIILECTNETAYDRYRAFLRSRGET
jgi:hypothetical protein